MKFNSKSLEKYKSMKIRMDAYSETISPHWVVSNKLYYVKKTPKQFENDFEFFHLDIPNLSLGMGLRHLYIHKIEIYLRIFIQYRLDFFSLELHNILHVLYQIKSA